MNTARLTRKARQRAERLMHDECEIRRPPTLDDLDTGTGERAEIPGELVYLGRCRVFTYEPFEATPESGQHVYTVQRRQVHIPVDVVGPAVNDVVEIVTSDMDPDLVGRRFRVAAIHRVTFARDQRLLVDEITA